MSTVVRHVPSAFNSQSTRVVLLLGESHKKLWKIVKDALKKIVLNGDAFVKTEEKIDHSFACGYGTVLFFEDQKVVKGASGSFSPLSGENFPGWSLQTSAMHQLAMWTMLEDVGFGASLQHYNPLIDEVRPDMELAGALALDCRNAVRASCRKTGRKKNSNHSKKE